jgi:uncharacterized repeat protein (TIGR02543 family)
MAPVDNNRYEPNHTVTVLGQGTMVRIGFNFQGWAKERAGKVEYKTGDTFNIMNDTVLYAIWEKTAGDEDPVDPPDVKQPPVVVDPPDEEIPPAGGNNPPGPGPTVVPEGDEYSELDLDGPPLGEWYWDEKTGTWIFIEYPPEANLPNAGNSELPSAVYNVMGLFILGLAWPFFMNREERQVNEE